MGCLSPDWGGVVKPASGLDCGERVGLRYEAQHQSDDILLCRLYWVGEWGLWGFVLWGFLVSA